MAIKINGNTVIADNQAFTTTSTVSATGNITTAGSFVGNLVSTGPISTTGNVTGNFFIGNGSQLTGIDATAIQNGTANVRTFLNGNVTTSAGGTANVLNVTSTGTITTGTASVSGTVTGGNIATAGTVSATGNVTGGNIKTGNGVYVEAGTDQIRLLDGVVSATGNVQAGNLLTTGLISATGNVTGGNLILGAGSVTLLSAGAGNISVGGNVIAGGYSGGAISTFGNVIGANILTGGILSAAGNVFGLNAVFAGNLQVDGNITYINSNVVTINDVAINLGNNAANVTQVNNGGLELGPAGSPYVTFLYNSSANTWVSSAGLSAVANVVGGNITTGGIISATGNITGGNIRTGNGVYVEAGTDQIRLLNGVVSATGNIQGDNIRTGGIVSATGNITGGNIRTVGLISATGAITSGSDLSLTGNIVDGGALFVNTSSNGNITLNPNGTGVIILNKDLLNGQANGTGNIGNSTGYFNTIFAKATSAQYADLAEKYTADAEYEPGTVVMFGGDAEVTICSADACRRVAGVISTNPSYIMNGTLAATHVATVALTGRVPTRVTGTVRKGDLMVSAGNGRARAEADPKVGTVIGKALADFNGTEGEIEVVVGRF